LPTSIIELNNWYEGLAFFKTCLTKTIANKELIDHLGYNKLIEEKEAELISFPDQLKETIKAKIGEEKINAPISIDKINQFNSKTNEIISEAFKSYNVINNQYEDFDAQIEYIKTNLNGINSLFSKSSFTDNDISSLNFDSVLAGMIARETINYKIPNSFYTSRTSRYLLKDDDLIAGIKKLKINPDEFIIVGINLYNHVEKILQEFEDILCKISSSKRANSNTLFILKKKDLPFIIHEELTEKEIADYDLKPINKDIKLYTSVVELENQHENINWEDISNPNDIEINIKVSIAFITTIAWKKDRKVIQISIESPYDEQGVPNTIDEIEPY
jgi:hypothetical protein